jgi:hypothetical protein
MIKKITLTEEHLKIIPNFFIQDEESRGAKNVFIDRDHLTNLGWSMIEDLSILLGLYDKSIEATRNDAEGAAFPDDVEQHILEVYAYIDKNLYDIENIIHQFVVNGGITPGTYKRKDNESVWYKE